MCFVPCLSEQWQSQHCRDLSGAVRVNRDWKWNRMLSMSAQLGRQTVGRWKIWPTHAMWFPSFMDVQIMEKVWGKILLCVSVCSLYFYTVQLFCVSWLMVETLLFHAHLLKSDDTDNQSLEWKQLYSTLFIIIFNILIRMMWARDWKLFLRNMYLLERGNAGFRNRWTTVFASHANLHNLCIWCNCAATPWHTKTAGNMLWGLVVVSLTESGNTWEMELWECLWGFSLLC